jgi:hypothetical protein
MRKLMFWILAAAGTMTLAGPAKAATTGQGQAVVTVMPKNSGDEAINVTPQNLQLKVNGKESDVTGWAPARGAKNPLELVLLIDSSARTSLGTQLGEIEGFVKEMPNNAKLAIAYMENGRAVFAGPLSSEPAQVLQALHLPSGAPAASSSPYFCLSDLAQHWPSQDRSARREVVMVTDGVDYYQLPFDPDDPYVQAAITDSVRSGLVVFSIYWLNRGRADRTEYETNAGQSLLSEVTQATGGNSYWAGAGNPVSFEPFFKDLRQRFQNQYRLNFSSELKGKPQVETMSLKVGGREAKVFAPKQVYVNRAAVSSSE